MDGDYSESFTAPALRYIGRRVRRVQPDVAITSPTFPLAGGCRSKTNANAGCPRHRSGAIMRMASSPTVGRPAARTAEERQVDCSPLEGRPGVFGAGTPGSGGVVVSCAGSSAQSSIQIG